MQHQFCQPPILLRTDFMPNFAFTKQLYTDRVFPESTLTEYSQRPSEPATQRLRNVHGLGSCPTPGRVTHILELGFGVTPTA
eukprot:4877635-Amphidinium_carterae.1